MVLIFIILVVTACSRKNDGGGVVDGGGGGEVGQSSTRQVKQAFVEARALVEARDYRKNLFAQFVIAASGRLNFDNGGVPEWPKPFGDQRLFKAQARPNPLGLDPLHFLSSDDNYFPVIWEGSAVMALLSNPTTYLENGNCPAANNSHADASVSENSLRGRLCFSIGNLRRLPPEHLLQHVLSLMAHEAVHLGGGEEDEANLVQRRFNEFFTLYFTKLKLTKQTDITRQQFWSIQLTVRELQDFIDGERQEAAKKTERPTKYRRGMETLAGQLIDKIRNLPYFADPIRLGYSVKPLNPQYYDNYANAALSSLVHAHGLHGILRRWAPRNADLSDVENRLMELNFVLERTRRNFLAYAFGLGPSYCELPPARSKRFPKSPTTGELLTISWLPDPDKTLGNHSFSSWGEFTPPRECAPGSSRDVLHLKFADLGTMPNLSLTEIEALTEEQLKSLCYLDEEGEYHSDDFSHRVGVGRQLQCRKEKFLKMTGNSAEIYYDQNIRPRLKYDAMNGTLKSRVSDLHFQPHVPIAKTSLDMFRLITSVAHSLSDAEWSDHPLALQDEPLRSRLREIRDLKDHLPPGSMSADYEELRTYLKSYYGAVLSTLGPDAL